MKLKFGFVKLRYRGLQKKLFGLCSTNHGIPLEFSSAFSMVHRLHTKCRLTSAIDARTTQHVGYAISQRKRKRIEECFGWLKTIALLRKVRHRGIFKVGWIFTFAA